MIGRIFSKIANMTSSLFAGSTRKKLLRLDFLIISNNSWAGSAYRYYGLPYATPIAGLYYFADDFPRLFSRLSHYASQDFEFTEPRKSRHFEMLEAKNELHVPIGLIDDVEIVFLHYPTQNEAAEKWKRRCKRINRDNMF